MFALCAVFVYDGLQIPVPFNAGSVACRVRLIRMDGCPGGAFYVDVDWAGGKGVGQGFWELFCATGNAGKHFLEAKGVTE